MSFSYKREVRAVLWIQNQSRAPIGRNKREREIARGLAKTKGPKSVVVYEISKRILSTFCSPKQIRD